MKYAEYQTKVEKVLSEWRDGAVNEEYAVVAIRALENIFTNGQTERHNSKFLNAANVTSGCCETEEEDIDPEMLLKEYMDLPDEDLRLHFTTAKEALFRRLGEKGTF